MKQRTFVYISCSPHPRVGTTLTARLLADYFLASGRTFKGFDTNPQESAFAGAHRLAEVVDISTSRGQVKMFDALIVADEVAKIVDLWQPVYRTFFAVADNVGFLEEADRAEVTPVLLYHADQTATSVEACRQLAARWPGVEIVLVHDEGAVRLGSDASHYLARYHVERGFRIAALDPHSAAALDEPELSLSELYLAGVGIPEALEPLRPWLKAIFDQFWTFELRHALEDSEYLW